MQTREFGSAGPPVSIIGQGTWQLERRRRNAVRALRRGVEQGLRHIDTAEIYGNGAVESLVGEALKGLRDEVFLVSKIDPARATRREAARACEESLTRLRTDRLDAYLLHWLPPHSLAEAVEAMEALVEDGRVRWWGVSNFDEVKLDEAVGLAGPARIACNQVLYHLDERSIEQSVLPCCRRHGVALVGYSPFAVGAFPGPETPRGRVLEQIGADHGASPRQVALAFLTRRPGTFTIPRASTAGHVDDNAAAAGLMLSEAELTRIDATFPLGPRRPGIPML